MLPSAIHPSSQQHHGHIWQDRCYRPQVPSADDIHDSLQATPGRFPVKYRISWFFMASQPSSAEPNARKPPPPTGRMLPGLLLRSASVFPLATEETAYAARVKSCLILYPVSCAIGTVRSAGQRIRLVTALFEKSPANACSIRPATVLDSIKQVADHTQHLAKLTHLGNEVAEIPF